MIVDRREFLTVKGCRAEAVAALKEVFELWERKLGPITYRIYGPLVATFGVVAWETEFDSLADWRRLIHEFLGLAESDPLMERWAAATQEGGSHELWELE